MHQNLTRIFLYKLLCFVSLCFLVGFSSPLFTAQASSLKSSALPERSESQSAANEKEEGLAPAEEELPLLPTAISGVPIEQVLNSPSYLRVLEKSVLQYERELGSCATPVYEGRSAIGSPQIARAFPSAGVVPQWVEIIQIGGCPAPYTRYVLVGIVNDAPHFHPLIIGNALSLLDLTVEEDVLRTLLAHERKLALLSGCSQDQAIRIHETNLVSQQTDGDGLVWSEEWQIENCKGKKALIIDFKTNPERGTDFTISQRAQIQGAQIQGAQKKEISENSKKSF